MDARDMSEFETGSFDAVIDKGMTDSVMFNDNFATMMAKVSQSIAAHLRPARPQRPNFLPSHDTSRRNHAFDY